MAPRKKAPSAATMAAALECATQDHPETVIAIHEKSVGRTRLERLIHFVREKLRFPQQSNCATGATEEAGPSSKYYALVVPEETPIDHGTVTEEEATTTTTQATDPTGSEPTSASRKRKLPEKRADISVNEGPSPDYEIINISSDEEDNGSPAVQATKKAKKVRGEVTLTIVDQLLGDGGMALPPATRATTQSIELSPSPNQPPKNENGEWWHQSQQPSSSSKSASFLVQIFGLSEAELQGESQPRVVFHPFEKGSNRVYAHWDWPKSEATWEFTLLIVDSYEAELPREMTNLAKEEQHYVEPKLRSTAKRMEVLNPQQTINPGRQVAVPRKYVAHSLAVEVQPGTYAMIRIELYRSKLRIAEYRLPPARQVFNRKEMEALYKLALRFIDKRHGVGNSYRFDSLHRCKPHSYFTKAFQRHDSTMFPYLKDYNGHAASPINGRLEGLFFSVATNLNYTSSPFGEVRFEISAAKLLNMREHRVYFADFYCNHTNTRELYQQTLLGQSTTSTFVPPHYVTLVVCKRGSVSDQYCAERDLIELDLTQPDSILHVEETQYAQGTIEQYFVAGRAPHVWVEAFYTEPVDLKEGAGWKDLTVIGAGRSANGGLRRVPDCKYCDCY